MEVCNIDPFMHIIDLTDVPFSGDRCLTSFMTSSYISQQAVFLGELTNVDSKDQWLFPQLRITCSTTITRVRFVGEHTGDGNKIPELQIWRRDSPTSSRYSRIHRTEGGAVISTERSNMYATFVSWQVQAGDVFGVYQPDLKKSKYNFAMQEGGGELSYMLENERRAPKTFDTSNYDSDGHPYPLVNLDASESALSQ